MSTLTRAMPLLRATHSRALVVGACDPSLVATGTGGTPSDPCPTTGIFGTVCNETDTVAWINAAAKLESEVDVAWTLLRQIEESEGTVSERLRLQGGIDALFAAYKKLPKEAASGFWSGISSEIQNKKYVHEIIAWMDLASCRLGDINEAIKKYKFVPPTPAQPSGGGGTPGGTVIPTAPPTSTPGEKLGSSALGLLVVGGLAVAAFMFARKRSAGGSASRSAYVKLPPVARS